MTAYENVTEQETTVDGYSESIYLMQFPWLPMGPPSSGSASFAGDVRDSLRKASEDIFPVFSAWQGLDSCYDAADKAAVMGAMEESMGRTMGLKRMGELLHVAVSNYNAALEGYAEEQSDYHLKAKAWVKDRLEYEAFRDNHDEEAFEREYKMSWQDYQATVSEPERERLTGQARRLHGQLESARQWLARDLDAIKGDDLDDVTFNAREEALASVDSTEELAHRIKDGGAFEEMDLTDAEIEFLAGRVDLDSLPYDFETTNPDDPEGEPIRWVVGVDGALVRQGSPLDPNLNHAIIEAMDDNSGIYAKAAEYYDVDLTQVSGLTTTSSGVVLGVVDDQAGKAIEGLPDVDSTSSRILKGASGTFVSVIEMAPGLYNNKQIRELEEAANPLLTDDQLDSRKRNNDARTVTSTVVGVGVGVGVGVVGGGPVAGTVTGLATGPVIEGQIDKMYTKDWTYDELRSTSDPFEAERERDAEYASRPDIRAPDGERVTADNPRTESPRFEEEDE